MKLGLGLSLGSGGGGATFALDLNFAASDTLDPRVTFTRASSATRFNSAGTLVTMTTDQPRFDYNPSTLAARGLLIEEARTNLQIRSQEMDNAEWATYQATVTANSIAAPDGTTTMEAIVEAATTDGHCIYSTTTTTTAVPHAFSVFVKAGTRNFVSLRAGVAAGALHPWATFNLTDGTSQINAAATSASAVNCGGGIWRLTIIATPTAATQNYVVAASNVATAPGTGVQVGNSYLGATGSPAIYAWGAQVEAGAFATSYIPTVAATVARAADVASMTGTNFSSWYNQSAGTFVVVGEPDNPTTNASLFFRVTDTVDDSMFLRAGATGTTEGHVLVGGVLTGLAPHATFGTGEGKYALAYAVNDYFICVNGDTPDGTVVPAGPPAVDRMKFSSDIYADTFNGHLKRLTYYNTRKTNAELQTLTT